MVREHCEYLRPQHSVWFYITFSAAAHAGLLALLILIGTIQNNGYLKNNHRINTVLRWGIQKPNQLPDKLMIAVVKPPREIRPSKNARVIEQAEDSKSARNEDRVDYSEQIKKAISSLLTQKDGRTSTDEDPAGFKHGSKNGDSTISQQGNEYLSNIERAIKANYSVPSMIRPSERMFLRATVTVRIDSSGSIIDIQFNTRSGNQLFDDAVEATIRRAAPFSPPPEEMAGKLSKSGITIEFDAKGRR